MKKFNKPKFGYKGYATAINGIANFQQEHYPSLIQTKDPNQYLSKLGGLIRHFLEISGIEYKKEKSYSAIDYNANLVQENWKQFKEYLKNSTKTV